MRRSLAFVLLILLIMVIQPVASADGLSEGTVYRIQRTYIAPNNSSYDAMNAFVRIYLLDNRIDWASQQILSEEVKLDGSPLIPPTGGGDNRPMRIKLGELGANESKTIWTSQVVKVNAKDLPIDPDETAGPIPTQYQAYTKPVDHLWQSDDLGIENKALQLTAGEVNWYSKALRILEWVENHFTYRAQAQEHDARWGYESNVGDCSEYSNLFIALARAAGIPAKAVSGYLPFTQLYGPLSNDLLSAGHQWAIVYLPGVGWTSVDLTYNIPQGQYGELSDDHLIELASDGSNWVNKETNDPQIPASYVCYEYIVGSNPDVKLETSGTVTRVVSVEPSISASSIVDGTWTFKVKVRNAGSQSVSDVEVKLEVDNAYFEAPPAETLGDLNSGLENYVHFDVLVKESVENSIVTAVVTYDAGEYGSFLAKGEISVTAQLAKKEFYELPISWSMVFIFMILIGCAIGAAALLRR